MAEVNTATLPLVPPVTPEPPLIPNVEVAIHCVPVPVEIKTFPWVPDALVLSNKAPVNLSFPATTKLCVGVVVPIPRKLEIVVDPVTDRVLEPELKVKLVEVARGLVPLPKRMSLAVTAWLPVPPLATGNTPVTLEVKLIRLAVICWPESER